MIPQPLRHTGKGLPVPTDGHIPIIDTNPRGNTTLKQELEAEEQRLNLINFERPEGRRYKERSNVERVNGRLKDEFK